MTSDRRNEPPPLGRHLVRWLLPRHRREEAEGDLEELWRERVAAGHARIRSAHLRDLISLVVLSRRLSSGSPQSFQPSPKPPRTSGVDAMFQDSRFALRLLRRQPRYAALVIATLTLGIATSIAIFSVCDRVLLKPLPYPDADRLISIADVPFAFNNGQMRISKMVSDLPIFSGVGLYAPGGLNLGDTTPPTRLRAAAASSGFFAALGVTPLAGRTYSDDEDRESAKVAVVAFGAWRRLFGAAALVGTSIRLNGQSFQVLGVMPSGFTFPADTDIWIPPASDRQITGDAFGPSVVARLRPGVSDADVRATIDRMNHDRQARNPDLGSVLKERASIRTKMVGRSKPTLLFLTGIVGLLLVVACANVAGLMLARVRVRERELLVRAALGAGRARLVRQLVTESMILTAIGGIAGTLAAIGAIGLFAATLPDFAPDADLTSLDPRFALLATAVVIVTGLLFSVGPAIAASRHPTGGIVRQADASPTRWKVARYGLVLAQVAAALVLLTTTSAAFSVVKRLAAIDLGFRNEHGLIFDLTLPTTRYSGTAAVTAVSGRIEDRLRQIPGAQHVGLTNLTPGSPLTGVGIALGATDRPDPVPGGRIYAQLLTATPDYFAATGIPLVAGRAFQESDRAGAPMVAILSESAARALWPRAQDAIGKRFRSKFLRDGFTEADIVGVVADVRLRGVLNEPSPQVYFSFAQQPPFGSAGVALSVAGDPERVVPALRQALAEVDPELPPYDVQMIRDVQRHYLASQRLTLALTAAFAMAAVLLCALGLYGMLAQIVGQRTREIGIRMALGADRGRLRRGVLGMGAAIGITGVAVGACASGLVTHVIARFVPALDPPSIASVLAAAVLLVAICALAAWIPARRASAIDPLAALRAE